MMRIREILAAVTQLPAQCPHGLEVQVNAFASLEYAKTGQITFLSHPKYAKQLSTTQADAVIVPSSLWAAHEAHIPCAAVIVTDNPYAYFAYASQHMVLAKQAASIASIHPSAVIDASASIGQRVQIDAYAVIGAGAVIADGCHIGAHCTVGAGVQLGQSTRLYPQVTLYHGVQLGARCLVHSGAVIGSDGFGFAPHNKQWVKIPQTGTVCIGDGVEIGANCTIDRGALGDTVIGCGTKLDNLIHIAHNVHIGEDCAFAANIAIAGSAVVGNRVQMGGKAGILGHLTVCDDVVISSCTLITKGISKPGFYSGVYPFEENADWEKNAVSLKRLSKLREQVRALDKQVNAVPTESIK